MMSEIESIKASLPGIDCGSCGAPTCMAFAEDIVRGQATADECTVIMKMLFHRYLEEHKEKSVLDKLASDAAFKKGARTGEDGAGDKSGSNPEGEAE